MASFGTRDTDDPKKSASMRAIRLSVREGRGARVVGGVREAIVAVSARDEKKPR